MRHLSSVWIAALVLLTSRTGLAQEQFRDVDGNRGPRFLLASASGQERLPVDVARTPSLRRRISIAFDGVTLKEALTEVAQKGNLSLVYSRDIVSLDSPVHFEAENITVAGALSEVLLDAGVDVLMSPDGRAALVRRPVAVALQTGTIVGRITDKERGAAIVGATLVVEGTSLSASTDNDGHYRISELAPGTYTVRARYIGYAPAAISVTVTAGQEATADFALDKSAQRLDEVVTTGTMVPTEVKALPTPISVITADDIQRQNLQRIDQVFRGQVPGAITWDQGPGDNTSKIAIRGGSSLNGFPTVKTFIDGVEVASYEAIATIDPNSVERVEITRGPQASTLYGAAALDGVMQIFTKKGRLGLIRPEVMAKLSAGGVEGWGGQSAGFQTDNAISVLGGGEKTSYSLGGFYRHAGEWAPAYRNSNWGMSTGASTTQGPFTLSGSARYADKTFDSAWNTQLQSFNLFSQPSHETDRLRQQTYGVTASLRATRSWQHTLTLGYDQTYWAFYQMRPQFRTPADSFLYAYASHSGKISLLYHTDLAIRLASDVTAALTAGVNYDSFDEVWNYTFNATRVTGSLNGTTLAARVPWSSTGYFGQVQVNLAERLFLTGGLRAERNANFGAAFGTAWSPRVGAAYALALGPATVKLRASYGESIRAPDPGQRNPVSFPGSIELANPNLGPERQRGSDGGVEVYVGSASVGVTYYTQRAIDLIQRVLLPPTAGAVPTYQNQNLARVKNEGWEFEGRLPLGPVQLSGTYTITNSTIRDLPPNFPAGGYEVGDPVNGIPHTSAGATVTYSPLPQTTLTASMTHIGHWTETDWVSMYGYFFGGQPYRGSDRAYWIEYPTVTKFAVGVSQRLTKQVTGFVRAENLGNNLRSEDYNINIPMPRTVVVGANVSF